MRETEPQEMGNPRSWTLLVAAGGVALFLIVVLGSGCTLWPYDIDDPRPELRQRYEKQLKELLTINENGETIVKGEVTHTGQGCENAQQNCHFVLQFNDLPIYVYYRYTEHASCLNDGAVRQADLIRNGDVVEVFGKYYSVGSISTCDSLDYYIRKLE